MKIILTERNETIDYAAEELKKYITAMSRGRIVPTVTECGGADEGITLALLSTLSLDGAEIYDPMNDDIMDVDVKDGVGHIAGSNYRSILFGVYKYCYSLGCRYLRPGPDGDYIPKADVLNHSFKYRKRADSPIRCEIIEGNVSYEHCRETVLYLPKIYMNAYMIEGYVPYSYLHKWYGHVGNTALRRKGYYADYNMLDDYMRLLERDIKKTGLQLHTLGHAWMFEKLGMKHSAEARNSPSPLRDEYKKYVAEVGGKRELYHGSQFYTNFCYSNPEAREILVDTVVDYAKTNPHVDYVHLWLADSTNNWCECAECRKLEPSDHYVKFLNEVDAALTAAGLDTRIVLIMYVETVRPPKTLKLDHPERFIMTVAIGSHYENGYKKEECNEPLPPFELNNFKAFSPQLQFKCHDEWKKITHGARSAIFEYRFYMDHYADLGYMQIARETYRDMRSLDAMDFQGCMTDKTHRNYMPTALPMIVMGETLFDHSIDYETMTREYFEGAFGKDGAACREYLEKLTDLLSPSNFRIDAKLDIENRGVGETVSNKESWKNNPAVAEKAEKIPALLSEFVPVIDDNIAYATTISQMDSWRYLKYHSKIVEIFSRLLLAGAKGDIEKAQEVYFELEKYISENELCFHYVFDGFLFLRSLRRKIGLPAVPYYD